MSNDDEEYPLGKRPSFRVFEDMLPPLVFEEIPQLGTRPRDGTPRERLRAAVLTAAPGFDPELLDQLLDAVEGKIAADAGAGLVDVIRAHQATVDTLTRERDEARVLAEQAQIHHFDVAALDPCEAVLPWQDYDQTVQALGGCVGCGMLATHCCCGGDAGDDAASPE